MREKTDKFQQRSLDGFFKAGLKSCTEEACADRLEQQPEPGDMHMPDVMAMEVEMEVSQSAMSAFVVLKPCLPMMPALLPESFPTLALSGQLTDVA